MRSNLSQLIRSASFLAGTALVLTGGQTYGAEKQTLNDAFPLFESYIKITGQAASVSGDKSAFQSRTQLPQNGGAGIEDLHYSSDVGKNVNLQFDGRALAGSEDYLGKLRLTKSEVGSFEVGYKRFRTFYDGVGGFFPLSNYWAPLTNESLKLDRGKFWVEGTVALPNAPVFTVRYINELRNGQKDSTISGDMDFTSTTSILSSSKVRKVAPNWIDVGERHEELEATMKHTIKSTTLQLTLVGDRVKNLDTNHVTNTSSTTRTQLQQTNGLESQTIALTGKADTVINDKLTLRLGGSYQLVHADFTGNRSQIATVIATGVTTPTAQVQGLFGGSRIKVYTGNVALDYKATKDLFVKVALRAESEYIRSDSGFTVVTATTTTPRVDFAKTHQNSATPVLEVRYTGIKDLAVYFTGSQRNLHGVERNTSSYNPLTAANGTLAKNNVDQDYGNLTLGANWRQSPFLTLRAEAFRKEHELATVGFDDRLGDNYLLDSTFTGVKLSAVAKPTATLAFTTRYVYQSGKSQVTGYLPTFPAYDSYNAKNHIISETIDLSLNKQCYVQVNANVVFNTFSTVYPRAGLATGYDANNILQDSKNDYVTASVLCGFVVGPNTDAQVQFTYYRANNGDAALATMTLPYGVDAKDYMVTVGIKHKLSNKMVLNAKIGYCDSRNGTTGGFTNFKGPLAYVSLDHAF